MMKSRKKFLGILLTASIVATTVFPMQGTAAEGIGREMKSEVQKEGSAVDRDISAANTVSSNTPLASEMGDALIMPAAYDISQPVMESFELEENGKTLTKNDTLHFNLSAYDAESGISLIDIRISRRDGYNEKRVKLQHTGGNLYTGTFPCSELTGYEGEYYVSKIMLEDNAKNYLEIDIRPEGEHFYTFTLDNSRAVSMSDFQIQRNSSNPDGNLRVGDTVTYTARLECQGIEEEKWIRLFLQPCENSEWHSEEISMDYDSETQTVTGTFTVKDNTYPSEWEVNYIVVHVGENVYYHIYPNEIEPDKNLKFTVVNDNYDTDKPVIKNITIDKNGQMVKAGERITLKVEVEEEHPSSWMYAQFEPESPEASTLNYNLLLDRTKMEYSVVIDITQDTYPTEWTLAHISVYDANGNRSTLSDFREDWETARPWYFTVDPDGYVEDNEAPVIESITIDKNSQWVQPGENVTISVKVNEINPSATAYATFTPQASYVSGTERVTMYYNEDAKEYVGIIPINSETYPCEWMLADLYITDKKGYRTELSDFKPDWRDTCPWYYKVKTDGTYREDVKDISFSFFGLVRQENGSFIYGYLMYNEIVKNVGRRGSLKELGIWPSPPAEGVNVTWTDEWAEIVDEDEQRLFPNTPNLSYCFFASYDKCCVNVVLTYVSKDEGLKMAIVPQFVDKDATYGEMLDSLVLPEDANEELILSYKLDGSVDEMTQVSDIAYVGVEAVYDDCLVAWHMRYLDENGNEVSKSTPKTYKRGTAINDALAALEGPKAPEGMEFERWALPGIDGGEALTHDMTNLYVTAVYKGKTTADVSYTYRGEDGKLVSESRLMLFDGENLSYAAVGKEVTETLKEISHLKGLILSNWKGTSGIDIARYKKFNIQAQYDNCVVILKYPHDVYEYVVVDRGFHFELPVENEKYTDILWEGYDKGETVTITGDKEFLAADVKLKDGTEQEPSGGKLTAEEIEKIIADIEQGGSGHTLHVDMKKATVVPKEVLEAIQGKEVSIVLDMGSYSWTIGGTDVAAFNLKDIDLEVIVDTDVIPPAIVDSLAEGNPATQISLIHDGEFGFRADLTVNLGSQHSGSTGRLYYYDSAGMLIYRDAGEIGEDGNISLSFSHASDYVVVIEKGSSEDENNNDIENNNDNENNISNSGSDGKQEADFIAKAEDKVVLAASIMADMENEKPKSPKTGE